MSEITSNRVDPGLGLVPFTTGGASHLDYILDESKQPFLEIKVSVAT